MKHLDYAFQAAVAEYPKTSNIDDAVATEQTLAAVKAAAVMADASMRDNALSKSFMSALSLQMYFEEKSAGRKLPDMKAWTPDPERTQRWFSQHVSGSTLVDNGSPALMGDATAKFFNEGKLPALLGQPHNASPQR